VAVHVSWHPTTEPQLETLVESCNQLHGLSGSLVEPKDGSVQRQGLQRNGPWQWTESCSHIVALPGNVLTFEMALTSSPSSDHDVSYQTRLIRHFPPSLMYDQIVRLELDGRLIRPTNASLSRTLDLQFNRIPGGSRLSIAYQARVHFRAEPMRVVLGDTRLRWYRLPSRHNRTKTTTSRSIEPIMTKRSPPVRSNGRMIQESHSPLQPKSHVCDSCSRSASPGRSARRDSIEDQYAVVGQTT